MEASGPPAPEIPLTESDKSDIRSAVSEAKRLLQITDANDTPEFCMQTLNDLFCKLQSDNIDDEVLNMTESSDDWQEAMYALLGDIYVRSFGWEWVKNTDDDRYVAHTNRSVVVIPEMWIDQFFDEDDPKPVNLLLSYNMVKEGSNIRDIQPNEYSFIH